MPASKFFLILSLTWLVSSIWEENRLFSQVQKDAVQHNQIEDKVQAASAKSVLTLSLEQFLEKGETQWKEWIGVPLRIEGRYSSLTPESMRFQGCGLDFYLPANYARPLGRNTSVEVTGTIQAEKNGLLFQVESFRPLLSDIDMYHLRRRNLPTDEPERWYELGNRTSHRAKFYRDKILQGLAQETMSEGLAIERSLLIQPTREQLKLLAEKAVEMGAGERETRTYFHDYLRAWLREETRREQPDFRTLRLQIAQRLPGSELALSSLKDDFLTRYARVPELIYSRASDWERRQLARYFYLQVLREEYERKLSSTAASGDKVAEEYSQLAPEDPETAEHFRELALIFRTQNVARATRSEVLALAEEYRQKGQPEQARALLKTWLDQKTGNLASAGPTDYRQIALDYQAWTGNQGIAESILLTGIERYPDDSLLKSELSKLGFELKNGRWQRAKPGSPESELEQAIRSGRVVAGMKPEHVISVLGSPGSVAQIASAGQCLLIWNYPESRLAIRFRQRGAVGNYSVISLESSGP